MSAFIVSASHIDALLTFASAQALRIYDRPERANVYDTSDVADLTKLGKLLLRENEIAYAHRYQSISHDASNAYAFRFHRPMDMLSPVAIIKAAQCYDHQASEDPNYDGTCASSVIETIRRAAIRELPGYDEAAWEITQ